MKVAWRFRQDPRISGGRESMIADQAKEKPWVSGCLRMVLVGAAVSAVVFFLRLNRKDLDDLEELLETESEEDD